VKLKERLEAKKIFEGQNEEEIKKKLLEEKESLAEEIKEEREKEKKLAKLKVMLLAYKCRKH
jgi:hypothetical protein